MGRRWHGVGIRRIVVVVGWVGVGIRRPLGLRLSSAVMVGLHQQSEQCEFYYMTDNRYRNPINMDLNKPIAQFLKVDEQGFLVFTALNYRSAAKNMEGVAMLHQIIDSFGEKSAKAQNLSVPITSVKKINGTNQRLIFKIDNSKILGFIKSGEKNLFHRNKRGEISQLQPLCVLDFYVHESVQRSGVGKEIFYKLLKTEGREAKGLAYDRPSSKFTAFLDRHFNLREFVPQNNNFVIFNDYFLTPDLVKSSKNNIVTDSLSTFQGQLERGNPFPKLITSYDAKKYEQKNIQTHTYNSYGRRYTAPWSSYQTSL